jgi:hypothetical protein
MACETDPGTAMMVTQFSFCHALNALPAKAS